MIEDLRLAIGDKMRARRSLAPPAWGLIALCCLYILGARADITATVYPGYQFSPNERPTTATLNQLGSPTIVVSGTLGGTNVALEAGSVTGTMLSGTVVDGVTVDFNGSTPRAIEVMPQGVHTNQLDVNDFKGPIAGGFDTKVHLNYDGVTLKTNGLGQLFVSPTNQTTILISPTNTVGLTNSILAAGADGINTNITLGTNFNITAGQLRLTRFISTNVNLPSANGFAVAMPHGLSNAPTIVRWALVCVTANAGYVSGDEVEVATLRDSNNTGAHFSYGGNSTNVFIACFGNNSIDVVNFATQASTTITIADWKLKCYAYP